ncbi:protein kinase [Streptomyces sp. NPDC060198]|uniref:serine/threonine-protein kinase n=1 Tax=Streptomyces sp. NPDC060198 TaxID=3347070 RepID=UPI0036587957
MVELRGSGAERLEADDPARIGPIPLVGRLGAGGMGRVYLGVHEGRYVAVKQLLSSVVGEDEEFLRRFGRELDNLARLPAGATAPLLAGDRTARPPWFATAYVPGLTLRQALDLHGGPLPVSALRLLLREAAAALAPVHALDMVHRDLKPSNVMLTLDGLTLIDFGVARAAEQSQLTVTGMVIGTPAYMAPEQAMGARRLTGAADVFALGSLLAYAASGRPPFGDESGHGVLYRIVHEAPELGELRDLDDGLAELVAACLAKDPEARPTAVELLERCAPYGPFAEPYWPDDITARLTERAAFAADVREADVPTLPLGDAGPEPRSPAPESPPAPVPGQVVVAPGPGGTPAPQPGSDTPPTPGTPAPSGRPARRRRNRVLLAVVPVVVIAGGTTLVVQNVPYLSSPRAEADARPAGGATYGSPASAGPASSTAGSSPSGTATPTKPAGGRSATPAGRGKERQAGGGNGSQAAASAGGAATGTQGGADGTGGGAASTSGGAGTTGASGGSSNSGTTGTSGTTSTTGGTGSSTTGGTATSGGGPTTAPASGTYRYRNGGDGTCVTQVFGAASHQDCGSASARWTVQSRSDGSFKLVNGQSGQCLYSNGTGMAVFVGSCAQDIGRLWRAGSGGTLVSTYDGGCLDLPFGTGLSTAACDGDASQRWTRQS